MRNTGVCCVGKDNCLFPHHELNPEHTCIQCRGILHVMCAVWVPEKDGHRCKVSCGSVERRNGDISSSSAAALICSPTNVPPPSMNQQQTTTAITTNNTTAVKKCSQCGQSDHQRSSSKKCKYYNIRDRRTTTSSSNNNTSTSTSTTEDKENKEENKGETHALNDEDEEKVLDMTNTSYIYVGAEPEEEAKK